MKMVRKEREREAEVLATSLFVQRGEENRGDETGGSSD